MWDIAIKEKVYQRLANEIFFVTAQQVPAKRQKAQRTRVNLVSLCFLFQEIRRQICKGSYRSG